MKNLAKLKAMRSIAGIIVLAAVIGFLFVACDDGMQARNDLSGGSLNGTYYYTSSMYITFRTNGSWSGYDGRSGTYSVRGSTIELSRNFFGSYWTIINSNRVMDGQYDYWDRR